MIDIKKLREQAEAATPGSGFDGNSYPNPEACRACERNYTSCECVSGEVELAFTAAANPQTVLALLDRIDAVIKYCEPYQEKMWAASIIGELLRCDFRETTEAIKKYRGDV